MPERTKVRYKDTKLSGAPLIEDIEDFQEAHNILCHGDTGAGKNRLWGRLPNLLILAVEVGSVSIKKAGVKGAKVIRIRSWPEFVRAYEWIRDNPGQFDWVMIDSITKAQSMCIRYIMQMVVQANSERDPHIPAQGDHFKWQLWVKQMVEDFNELPENCIWLSRSMNRENPDGMDIVVPAIEGKDYGISAWVAGEMSLVCYLKKEEKGKGATKKVVRRLYTGEHPMYWCKDWYDVLPKVIEFESEVGVAQKIVNLLEGSDKHQTRTTTKKSTTARKKVAANG